MIAAVTIITNENLGVAMGPPGVPGDPDALVETARELARLYSAAIEWSLRVRRAHLPQCFRPVGLELAKFTDDLIKTLEEFGPYIVGSIKAALNEPSTGGQRELNLVLTPRLSNVDAFSHALEQARRDCFGTR